MPIRLGYSSHIEKTRVSSEIKIQRAQGGYHTDHPTKPSTINIIDPSAPSRISPPNSCKAHTRLSRAQFRSPCTHQMELHCRNCRNNLPTLYPLLDGWSLSVLCRYRE